MKKVIILGSIASGKSTYAKKMSCELNIPVYHLDQELQEGYWKYKSESEQFERVTEIANSEKWIMDGNYSLTLGYRASMADIVIFLDTNPVICVYRYIRRYIKNRGKARDDVGSGCKEVLSLKIVKNIIDYSRKKSKYEKIVNDNCKTGQIIHLSGKKKCRLFLESLKKAGEGDANRVTHKRKEK